MSNEAWAWIEGQQSFLTETLIEWANLNSGSYHLAGVHKMADVAEALFSQLGGKAERMALKPFERLDDQANLEIVEVGPLLKFTQNRIIEYFNA